MSVILDPLLPFNSQVISGNTIYVITGEMDLGNPSLNHSGIFPMPTNCTLRFEGGLLKNGVIKGVNTRIDNPSNSIIFDNVELWTDVVVEKADNLPNDPDPMYTLSPVTGWLGECRDIWFHYDESAKTHFVLVKSVCQFEVCSFTCRTYYIERWETIVLRPYGCIIYGGGATLIITRNKVVSPIPGWQNYDQYTPICLFEKHTPNRYGSMYVTGKGAGRFSVSDLTILDNNTLTDVPTNWGEDFANYPSRFVYYAIFTGSGNHTEFHNVKYDGRGGLWAHYNYSVAIEEIAFIDCDVKTSQFALELGNACRSDLNHRYPQGGSCKLLRISHSRFYNYAANVLAGPLSVVNQDDHKEPSITQRVFIDSSVFESEHAKNLELSGARSVYIQNCVFLSVFCSSENAMYLDDLCVEHPVNKDFHVIGNTFDISNHYLGDAGGALAIHAGDIYFTNNIVTVDFGVEDHPKGNFYLRGFGQNYAFVSQNTFIIKNTNNEYFKSLLFYEETILDLIGNSYCFLEGVKQGYEVSIGGRGRFLHLEVEDDPRFSNVTGGGFTHWRAIPLAMRNPEGFLEVGATFPLNEPDESFPADPAYLPLSVPLSSFEFDLKVNFNGSGKSGEQSFASFHAGSYEEGSDYYEQYVLFKVLNGSFRVYVALDDNVSISYYPFHSNVNLQLALPFFGLDAYGDSVGLMRVVLINETTDNLIAGEATVTRVILYLNDMQVDTFCLDFDILTNGITGIKLFGSPYVRIRNYRLRTQVKTTPNPVIADRPTINPNIGYMHFGTMANRPVSPETGFIFFDTQRGQPIFYTGSIWVDASGNNIDES